MKRARYFPVSCNNPRDGVPYLAFLAPKLAISAATFLSLSLFLHDALLPRHRGARYARSIIPIIISPMRKSGDARLAIEVIRRCIFGILSTRPRAINLH